MAVDGDAMAFSKSDARRSMSSAWWVTRLSIHAPDVTVASCVCSWPGWRRLPAPCRRALCARDRVRLRPRGLRSSNMSRATRKTNSTSCVRVGGGRG